MEVPAKQPSAAEITERLEYLRGELRGERISQGELIELQGLAQHIGKDDVELLEPAGVPESPSHIDVHPEFITGDLFCDRCDGSFPDGTLMLIIETDAGFIGALCSDDSPWPLTTPPTREQLVEQSDAIAPRIAELYTERGQLLLEILRLDVHRVAPTAVKVEFGTDEWDNGWFLNHGDVKVTLQDGTTVAWDMLDEPGVEDEAPEELDRGLMADLTDAFGPFGERESLTVDLLTLDTDR